MTVLVAYQELTTSQDNRKLKRQDRSARSHNDFAPPAAVIRFHRNHHHASSGQQDTSLLLTTAADPIEIHVSHGVPFFPNFAAVSEGGQLFDSAGPSCLNSTVDCQGQRHFSQVEPYLPWCITRLHGEGYELRRSPSARDSSNRAQRTAGVLTNCVTRLRTASDNLPVSRMSPIARMVERRRARSD